MSVSLSIIANTLFFVAAPHLEYEVGDFEEFGVRKLWRVRTESTVATYRWRAKAFGIYAGYEWHPGLERGPERGICYGAEGITITDDCVYFREGSFHCEFSKMN
jgi:hypothetical protein